MTICGGFAQMDQLNTYLPLLSCLKDNNQATYSTARINMSFLEHELAVIILRYMPKIFDDSYWLSTNYIPTALPQLHTKLKAVHRACEGTKILKRKGEPLASGQDGKKKPFKPSSNFASKKDKESWSKNREFSKKLCKHCEEHGGHKQQVGG